MLTQVAIDELVPLIEAHVPAQALAAYALIVHRREPSTREIADHFGVSRQTARAWACDLVAIGVVEKWRDGRDSRYRRTRTKTLSVRLRSDGRAKRCATPWCRRLNPAGTHCPACKQRHGRKDRAWHSKVKRLLREGMAPHAIHARLAREGVVAPVWDHTPEGQTQTVEGIVSLGLRLELLGPEWKKRQQEALSGGGDGW